MSNVNTNENETVSIAVSIKDDKFVLPNKIEYEFKWFCVRPNLPHEIFNWKFTFIFLCVCCFVENLLVSGVATVIISSIEKEFFLTSTQSGLFLGIFEIGAFCSAPIYGYLGTKFNKMKILSVSFFLVFSGAYLIAIIIFFKNPDYTPTNLTDNSNIQSCQSNSSNACFQNNLINSNGLIFKYMLYIGKNKFKNQLIFITGLSWLFKLNHFKVI